MTIPDRPGEPRPGIDSGGRSGGPRPVARRAAGPRPGGPEPGGVDRAEHPMVASLVLVIGVVLLIVLLSVASVYF